MAETDDSTARMFIQWRERALAAEAEVERLKESRGFWRKLTAKREAERDAWQRTSSFHLDERDQQRRRAEQAEAALERVRARHTAHDCSNHVFVRTPVPCVNDGLCKGCGREWPCDDIAALDHPADTTGETR